MAADFSRVFDGEPGSPSNTTSCHRSFASARSEGPAGRRRSSCVSDEIRGHESTTGTTQCCLRRTRRCATEGGAHRQFRRRPGHMSTSRYSRRRSEATGEFDGDASRSKETVPMTPRTTSVTSTCRRSARTRRVIIPATSPPTTTAPTTYARLAARAARKRRTRDEADHRQAPGRTLTLRAGSIPRSGHRPARHIRPFKTRRRCDRKHDQAVRPTMRTGCRTPRPQATT